MTQRRINAAFLITSDILMAASIALPWMILSLAGEQVPPVQQIVSPASMVWYAIIGADYQMGIPATSATVMVSVIYIVAALCMIGVSAPVVWGGIRSTGAEPSLSDRFVPVVSAGAVVCGSIALMMWLVAPVVMGLGTLPADMAFGPGIFVSLAGLCLTALSYWSIATPETPQARQPGR